MTSEYEKHYRKCIANGCSPGLADMLASQQAPACETDTRRAIGHGTIYDQCGRNEGVAKRLVKATQKENNGWTPPYNWVRNSNLAKSPGDRLAWCPPHEIESHMRKVSARRGHRLVDGTTGRVKVKGREPLEDPMKKRKKLADSLVRQEFRKRVKACPEIAKAPIADKRELCRQIVAQHGQK